MEETVTSNRPKNKNLTIVIVVALLIIILVPVTLVIILLYFRTPYIGLHTPELDALIAYDSAYLEVLPDSEGGESSQISLNFTSLTWAESRSILSLSGPSGEIFICGHTTPSEQAIAEFCLEWQFTWNNGSGNLECSPSEKTMSWDGHQALICDDKITIPCRKEEKAVANIVLSVLRIEFDGDRDHVRDDDFTKKFDWKCP